MLGLNIFGFWRNILINYYKKKIYFFRLFGLIFEVLKLKRGWQLVSIIL